MSQTPKYVLYAFGAVLFAVCLGGLVWSLFQPPVTKNLPLPEPAPMQKPN